MTDTLDPGRHGPGADNGEEVAAYALGALEPAEATAFARHLESCSICRDELEAFCGVVELLPLSIEAHAAPGSLRRRVLREVRADARRPEGARAARLDSRAAARRRPWRPARSRRLSLSLAGAVAVILAVIAGLGGFSSSPPALRTIRAEVIGPGQASLKLGAGRAELVVTGLPAPPAGKIYQVWLARRHGAPQPTDDLFSVTRAGRGEVMVAGDMHGIVEVTVTPEPDGGSRHPTHPPVIVARI